MRTVTFSDAKVAKAVNGKFIATWVNRQVGFHNCETETEKRIKKYQYECFATKNFCTFFTTPDLDVLHYQSGYSHPGLFLEELDFVHKVASQTLDPNHRYMEDALPEFRALHEEHAGHHSKEESRIRKLTSFPGVTDSDVFHSRQHSYAQGMQNLCQVHFDLVQRAEKLNGPVPLADVFNDYKYSNGFEEVIRGDHNRKTPDNPGMK
jgi:hypothetical protein